MSDIVKLLLRECDHQLAFGNDMSDVLLPAAAEIARFRAENERLRARVEVLERACRLIQIDPSTKHECKGCYLQSRLAFLALEEAKP